MDALHVVCALGIPVETSFWKGRCHPALLLVTVDLPARALITCMKQYNGKSSCLYCEQVGTVVSTQTYWPYENEARTRTQQSLKRDAKSANSRGEPVRTVLSAVA